MEIRFDYPAIVSGNVNPDGSIRHDLVRIPDTFEIKEVSDADLPPSFEIADNTRSNSQNVVYRFADGRHFKPILYGRLQAIAYDDSSFRDEVLTGRGLAFQGLKDVVRSNIAPLRIWEINNTERRVTTREQIRGLDGAMVAINKAPHLKNWKWLGADLDKEIATWKERVQGIFERYRIVGNTLYVETHEPCYEVQHAAYGGRSERYGKILVGSKSSLGHTLKPILTEPNTGFEVWESGSTLLGKAMFSANAMAQVRDFIEEAKWKCYESLEKEIIVHNKEAVSDDFMDLEAVRTARTVFEFGKMMEQTAKDQGGSSFYKNSPVDLTKFMSLREELRASIVEWQAEKQDVSKLERVMMALFNEMNHWERGQNVRAYSRFILPDQIEAFNVMRDQSDITLVNNRWSPKAIIR
jgi:hypothetical protein